MLRICLIGLLLSVGCQAPVGSTISVPPDAAQTCAGHCQSIGMRLSAVAIMANNVGCVCQLPSGAVAAPTPVAPVAPVASPAAASPAPPPAAATQPTSSHQEGAEESATVAAGMATLLLQQEAARRQQESNRPPYRQY